MHGESNKLILEILTAFLEAHPEQRFGQALFNLNINMFADKKNPANANHLLKDIYNDSSLEILSRLEIP